MKTVHLIELNRRLDTALNEFALEADANGQYPWQVAQQQKQRRRMVGAGVGAAAIGVGAYGVKKGHEAIMKRGMSMAGGPVRARDAYKAVAGEGLDKLKEKAGATVGRVVNYGKNVAGKYDSMRAGASAGLGLGRRAGIMAALKHVKFTRAEVLVELEAKLDGELQEFEQDERRKNYAGAAAGTAAAGAAVYGADRALMKRARNKHGDLSRPNVTRATAYGEGLTDTMKSGKRMYRKGMAQASYRAEPLVRKVKGMMGLRKVAGMLK
jgi:hypothetical protein